MEGLREVGFTQYHFLVLCFPPSALAGCRDLWILKTGALPQSNMYLSVLHHSGLYCEGLGVIKESDWEAR